MEATRFDTLLRKAAQHATRREALGALIGSALLLNDRGESEATKKAERRKQRKKRQRSASLYRGISIEIDNMASAQPVVVNHGAYGLGVCCKYHFDGHQAARSSHTFQTSFTTGWVRINNTYWFQFTNPPLTPYVKIAVNGKFPSGGCCNVIPDGQIIADLTEFTSGQTRTWNIQDTALISITRRPNARNHIQFRITLPPNLPQG